MTRKRMFDPNERVSNGFLVYMLAFPALVLFRLGLTVITQKHGLLATAVAYALMSTPLLVFATGSAMILRAFRTGKVQPQSNARGQRRVYPGERTRDYVHEMRAYRLDRARRVKAGLPVQDAGPLPLHMQPAVPQRNLLLGEADVVVRDEVIGLSGGTVGEYVVSVPNVVGATTVRVVEGCLTDDLGVQTSEGAFIVTGAALHIDRDAQVEMGRTGLLPVRAFVSPGTPPLVTLLIEPDDSPAAPRGCPGRRGT